MNNTTIILMFLKAYKEWVDAGVPKHKYFDPAHGLCTNLDLYARYERYFIGSHLISLGDSLCHLFEADNLSMILPFNMSTHGQPRYCTEVHHENPFRMKWVADTIIKLEAKLNES